MAFSAWNSAEEMRMARGPVLLEELQMAAMNGSCKRQLQMGPWNGSLERQRQLGA